MTVDERELLVTKKFSELWSYVWYQQSNAKHTNIYDAAKEKYELLCQGFYDTKGKHTLYDILKDSKSEMSEPEWGFPKGRRRIREEDIHCALREFSEETGLPSTDVILDEDFNKYEEIFFGTNFILYRHVYYVGYIPTYGDKSILVDTTNINQAREVRSIEWFTYEESMRHIRDHNKERKNIFKEIHRKLVEKLAFVESDRECNE